jgi:hypothetical protein
MSHALMSARQQLWRGALLVAALALVFTFTEPRPAAGQPTTFVARFTATTAGLNPGTGVGIKVDVIRWSTDEEADKLLAAFKEKGEKGWAEALQGAPSVGYIWAATSSLGYSVKLARHVAMPDGTDRIVVAIDRPLGSWDRPAWKAAGAAAAEYPFSIVELRVNRKGVGEGKASLAAKVVVDDTLKAPALDGYAAAPVILKNVTRTATPAAAPAKPAAAPPAKPAATPPAKPAPNKP